MSQTALILGATGRFGRHAARQFSAAGWSVRRFDRNAGNLAQAANGVDVIVNGWNPPYPEWERTLPELHQQVISAARDSDATVIVPGNVYVFGPTTPVPWSERSAHGAENPLGRTRIAMEEAYRKSGVRTILLRAGDFLDTEPSGNWFDRILTARLARGILTYPGDMDAAHAWAFLPDLCRAAVALAGMRDQLPVFSDIPFPGYTLTGNDLAAALTRVTGSPVRPRRMSWLPMHLARPVWGMAGCLLEMRYLWEVPHTLDGSRFRSLLTGFRDTPLDDALVQAVANTAVRSASRPAPAH